MKAIPATGGRARAVHGSLLAGAVVALLIAVAGLAFASLGTPMYSAQASLVMLPSPTLSALEQANYFETLNSQQIVATFAEVAQNPRFAIEAQQQLKLSGAARAGSVVTTTIVPDTSVVLIQATARNPVTAERIASQTATVATSYFAQRAKPFVLDTVRPAAGTAQRTGTAPKLIVGVAIVAALAVGLAVQQAALAIGDAWRRSRLPLAVPPAATSASDQRPSGDQVLTSPARR